MAVARLANTSLAYGRATASFNAVKTFTATLGARRNELGDIVTSWLQAHPDIQLVDIEVTQSSDAQFHCLTITLFFIDAPRR